MKRLITALLFVVTVAALSTSGSENAEARGRRVRACDNWAATAEAEVAKPSANSSITNVNNQPEATYKTVTRTCTQWACTPTCDQYEVTQTHVYAYYN